MTDQSSNELNKIDELRQTFSDLDVQDRLETLLEYSEMLPDLPERFRARRGKAENKVHECQTPVYLWVEVVEGRVEIYADVPRDSPTVRGFISLLISVLFGSKPSEVLMLKASLLRELGLSEVLGMVRTQGLQAILKRVKSEVLRASEDAESKADLS